MYLVYVVYMKTNYALIDARYVPVGVGRFTSLFLFTS